MSILRLVYYMFGCMLMLYVNDICLDKAYVYCMFRQVLTSNSLGRVQVGPPARRPPEQPEADHRPRGE